MRPELAAMREDRYGSRRLTDRNRHIVTAAQSFGRDGTGEA